MNPWINASAEEYDQIRRSSRGDCHCLSGRCHREIVRVDDGIRCCRANRTASARGRRRVTAASRIGGGMRPRIICHMVSSIDGRLLVGRWTPPAEGIDRLRLRGYYEEVAARLGGEG